MRIGQGYDVHRLVEGRKLMLGGADIPHEKSLLGHSDADVLPHAISDALLDMAAFGDIDAHLPNSDPAYSGANSAELLRTVGDLIRAAGYEIGNIGSTVICQASKFAPHIDTMRVRITEVLTLPVRVVNVKASSEEHMGFTGRGEGTAAHAACLPTERTKQEPMIQ